MSLTKSAILAIVMVAAARAGTYTASNCNQATVNALINGPGEDATHHVAVDGDVIVMPAGSCTWTSGIVVPTGIGITITGTGTPNSTPDQFGASASCSNTSITIGSTNITGFVMKPTYGNSTSRLSCFALNYSGGNASAGFKIQATCAAGGCPLLRMDNLSFGGWKQRAYSAGISAAIGAIGNAFGVIDHNTVVSSGVAGGASAVELTLVSLGSYLGVGHFGDKDWAMPENWGSNQFIFIENNIFSDTSATEHEGSAGGYEDQGGGRIVARFNQYVNMAADRFALGWHGTESNGRPRGVHAFEFYKNTETCASVSGQCMAVVSARSGTGIMWGNSILGSPGVWDLFEPTIARTLGTNPDWSPWKACDGTSPYDTNDATVYWSGTIQSVGSSTITVSGTPWTDSQWSATASYSVHNNTTQSGAIITANTTNQLTYGWFGGTQNYAPGDSIEIRKAVACLDSAGRGAGVLYDDAYTPTVGGVPNVSSAQAVTPSYLWDNAFSVSPGVGTVRPWPPTGTIVKNSAYYVEDVNQVPQSSPTVPFDGSTTGNNGKGIGHGTIANRPSNCTTGVAYWATDEGTWNTSGSGGQGRLYKCTSTNTWTAYYTPYTYPHPLVSNTPYVPPVIPAGKVQTNVKLTVK